MGSVRTGLPGAQSASGKSRPTGSKGRMLGKLRDAVGKP